MDGHKEAITIAFTKHFQTYPSSDHLSWRKRIFLFSMIVLMNVLIPMRTWAATLSVDGTQQWQTMAGFGVSANSASWNNGELRPALDMLVDQLGATLWRVIIDEEDWEASNDDADPFHFNWTYYNTIYTSTKFEKLWSMISYLTSKGIPASGIILDFMGTVPNWMGSTANTIDTNKEDEFVEMVVSLVYYARITRGLQFTELAPMNEPQWDAYEGPNVGDVQYARIMGKLVTRLSAEGLTDIKLACPDRAAGAGGFTPYFDTTISNSTAMSKVNLWTLHDYAGGSMTIVASDIAGSAYPTVPFIISEVANYYDVWPQIGQGAAGYLVWEGYESVYNHAIRHGSGSQPGNDLGNGPALLSYNTSTHTYTPVKAFYEHAQIFKFITPGTRRIAATDSDGNLQVYAFSHPTTNRVTIVGRNTGSSSMAVSGSLANLPTVAAFESYQTNGSLNLQRGVDVTVSSGQFTLSVPGNTLFSLTGLADGVPTPTVPPSAPTNLQVW